MAEFLSPRMPDEDGETASSTTGDARSAAPRDPRGAGGQVPLPPDRFGAPDGPLTPEPPPEEPQPVVEAPPAPATRPAVVAVAPRPGSLARLISVIVSVGLAWALTVAVTAWLLGLFLARG